MTAALYWLELDRGDLGRARRLLSLDELARAARLRQPRVADRFVRARAALRSVLGRRVGVAPERLRFVYGPHGKPALPGGPAFSLAHSGGLGLLAVDGAGRELGVDLEPTDRPLDLGLARWLAPGERRALWALPPLARPAALVRCWVRKEAVLKAMGEGLAGPLEKLEVPLDAACRAPVQAGHSGPWLALEDLWAPPGFAAALAQLAQPLSGWVGSSGPSRSSMPG